MKGFLFGTGLVAVTVMTALALSAAASAAPTGSGSASDVIGSLQAQGYSVQINGQVTAPLSQCTVTGVHGLPNSGSGNAIQFTTVYVDLDCPPTNN